MREITVVVNCMRRPDADGFPVPDERRAAMPPLFAEGTPVVFRREFAVLRAADGRVGGLFWNEDEEEWTAKVTFTALPGPVRFRISRLPAPAERPAELVRFANRAGILEVKIPAAAGEMLWFEQE